MSENIQAQIRTQIEKSIVVKQAVLKDQKIIEQIQLLV
jgi:hypothetical protein